MIHESEQYLLLLFLFLLLLLLGRIAALASNSCLLLHMEYCGQLVYLSTKILVPISGEFLY